MNESTGVRLSVALVLVAAVWCAIGCAILLPERPARAEAGGPAGWEELGRHPGGGEQCLVCSQPIEGETAVRFRHRGRTFHVKESMLPELRRDPDSYFRKLQARSGLFDEEAIVPAPPLRWGWLAGGVYLLVGLLSAAVAGSVAMIRARPVVPWFVAGLVGNVFALGALAATADRAGAGGEAPRGADTILGKIPRTRQPRPCPACGAGNHPSAAACTACGTALEPEVEAETRRVGGDPGGEVER